MQFTKWRYKSGSTPSGNIAEFMEDMQDGQLIQLILDSCPQVEEGISALDETYCRLGGCWCTEETRYNCGRDI